MILLYWWTILIAIGMLFYWFFYKRILDFSLKMFGWTILNFFSIPFITLGDIWADKAFYQNSFRLLKDTETKKKICILRMGEIFYFTLVLFPFINNLWVKILIIFIYTFLNLGSITYTLTHKIHNLMVILNFIIIGYLLYLFF